MNITTDKQVQITIAIIVGPGRSDAESAPRDVSTLGNIFEFAPTEIVVEHVVAITSNVDIGQTIVIKVPHGDAQAPAARREASRFCDVREVEIGVLAIESDHRVTPVKVPFDRGIIHDNNVLLAIVITVEQGNTTAHRFNEIALVRRRMRNGRESGLKADVTEMHRRSAGRLRERQKQSQHRDCRSTHTVRRQTF